MAHEARHSAEPAGASARAIFDQALELESGQARQVYLDEACANQPELREKVEGLLKALERAGDFLESPSEALSGLEAEPDEPAREVAGTRIGVYKLLEQLGEGGMAVVFLAEQTDPIVRQVALKIIKPGMDSRHVIARFEAERQALALMDHPNIAKVLDAATTESGRPYFVMELVKGVPITKYCDEHQLNVPQRLELFVAVCQAVQHAHQKGIIHRDIKPSNVLIAGYDGVAAPKVIDFGVAKAMGQQLSERTMFTGFGAIVGTLEYMSPEQAELNQLDIDTRSDIYSLGVLLYELLTGTTPLEHERLKRTALDEVLRTIRTEEPPKPSTRLSTMTDALGSVAARRGLDVKQLAKMVHGELDWIVMKGLEKDRNRRYQAASDLAMDVVRYLHGEMVLACPPSASYRLRKFVRRHKAGLLATVGAFAALVALVVVLSISNVRVSRERNQKTAALLDAHAQRERAEKNFAEAQAQRQRAEKNFVAARQAVASLMAQPATGMGEWQTLSKPLRKKFADEALKYYNKLGEQGSDDPSLQYETAVGYRSIGYLHYRFQEYPESEKLARRSIGILEGLNKQDPRNRDYRQQLAWSRMLLGWVFLGTNRAADADVSYRQAAPLLEQLLSEDPKHQSYSIELIQCYANVAQAFEKQSDALDAEQFKQRATDLLSLFPTQLPHKCVLQHHVGKLLTERGLAEDAVAMHRQALARVEGMREYSLGQTTVAELRVELRAALAESLLSAKQVDEAIDLVERDAAAFPKDALCQHALGHMRARLAQWDKAAAAFDRCLALNPSEYDPWCCAAAVYLWAGDVKRYRSVCAAMLERYGKPASISMAVAERTTRMCALIPDAVEDFAEVERFAERMSKSADKRDDRYRFYLLAKGLVGCRAAHYAQAAGSLGQFAPDPQGMSGDATAFAALAVAKQKLGDKSSAKAALAKAQAIIAQKMPDPAKGQTFEGWGYVDWLQAQLWAREAEAKLSGASTKP